nr:alpha-amylase family glycosyl hydrolase [bacterium]
NSRVDTLDKVPEEELERLAARGFNALWLIGLWSRSHASRRIKQMCGNPEAAASAYAIYDYRIDDDLGGEAAFEVLKHRAARYGIRMAGDMVPNHMGIDSWWVCEHPEWFIAAEHNPFPRYSYSGVDLSRDSKCSIFLEDHYYDRTDAAVTFKYVDHWNHRTLYIYHGNDGTDLPWNDTAQLNFLREDVREQVIRTIIDVARRFPIIRFDAAMTLARKHYHRLWFPEPGGGGDIPSRSRFGMSREAFDEQMPVEFWREVVDRIGREAPDTLLLAEAFWLMEGYFVRSLGMHRVYNSAFMNMLRDEDNQKYRSVIKNTIEFDPEILKRYVNFMNNPDEEPAALQFGRGEKYFGVCAMMCTLPGLPMFGHGQYEGYAEKYGMEYRRSYWNETVDTGLLTHHQRVITPILRRRAVFSGASSFRLFDMVAGDGGIDENVFAYANRHGDSRGLFIFNNASHPTEGTLRMSAAWNSKDGTDEGLQQEMLSESLQLTGRQDRFVLLHDLMSRRWFIRNSRTLHREGFFVQLSPYGCFVFVDIREVAETEDQRYSGLETHLGGGGCRDIEGALLDLKHQSLHDAFRSFFDDALIDSFREMTGGTGQQESDNHVTGESERLKPAGDMIDLDAFTDRLRPAVTTAIHAAAERGGPDPENCLEEFIDDLEELLPEMSAYRRTYPDETRVLILWFSLIVRLADRFGAGGGDKIDNARLWRLLEDGLAASGMSESMAGAAARLVNAYAAGSDSPDPVISVLQSEDGRRWIQAHRFRGTVYFNREAFEEFLEWMILWHRLTPEYRAAAMRHAEAAGFRLEELLDALSSDK